MEHSTSRLQSIHIMPQNEASTFTLDDEKTGIYIYVSVAHMHRVCI